MLEKRFEHFHGEILKFPKGVPMAGQSLYNSIIKDRVTGVLYLYTQILGASPTMTPLLDADGKPLVDKSGS